MTFINSSNQTKTQKILFYYMRGIADGGSDHSLYNHIINLDKSKFEPLFIFREKRHLAIKLQEKNIFSKRDRLLSIRHNFKVNKEFFIYKILDFIPGSKTLLDSIVSFFEIIFLVKVILSNKIDIIHLNNSIDVDRPALLAGILTRKKICAHQRGFSRLSKLDVYLSNFAEKIICISEYSSQKYINNGLAQDKCATIYNGIDLNRFSLKENKQNEFVRIGNIGRLETFKGMHIFIQAIPHIIKVHPEVKFLIVGSGRQKNNLIKLVDDLKILKYVTFTNPVESIEDVLSSLDIFAHTPIEPEPFGRVIIEAMAMGLPVISTNAGGPKEIITNDKDGFLIAPCDSIILSEKIIHLLENPEVRYQVGKNAIETVKNRFDIKITTRQIENLYNSLTLESSQ